MVSRHTVHGTNSTAAPTTYATAAASSCLRRTASTANHTRPTTARNRPSGLVMPAKATTTPATTALPDASARQKVSVSSTNRGTSSPEAP